MVALAKQISLSVLAAAFGAAFVALLFAQGLLEKARTQLAFAAGDECKDPAVAQEKENPNKALFVSCGGFLE